MKYFSQFKQDYIVDKFFNGKKNGVFVDIGAHDGVSFSNTYFFETKRKWDGICIEPIPEIFDKLKQNRKCHLVNGVIYQSNEYLDFKRIYGSAEMLSGIVNYEDKRDEERTKIALNKYGGHSDIIKVQGYILSEILQKFNIETVDYLSLDIEGGEFEVLESIDFDKIRIKYLTIENNYNDLRIRKLMKLKKYIFVFHYGADDFFTKKELYKKSLFFDKIIFLIWLEFFVKRNIPILLSIYKKIKYGNKKY
jgi:FkbM family methyltransferase